MIEVRVDNKRGMIIMGVVGTLFAFFAFSSFLMPLLLHLGKHAAPGGSMVLFFCRFVMTPLMGYLLYEQIKYHRNSIYLQIDTKGIVRYFPSGIVTYTWEEIASIQLRGHGFGHSLVFFVHPGKEKKGGFLGKMTVSHIAVPHLLVGGNLAALRTKIMELRKIEEPIELRALYTSSV